VETKTTKVLGWSLFILWWALAVGGAVMLVK